MPDIQQLVGWLASVGVVLAKIASSPLGGPFGAIVPVGSGIQALVDRWSGKVRLGRLTETNDPALDARRERLRKRTVRLWWAQIVTAIVSTVLIIWLYVVDEIPKVGTPPIATPSAVQSLLLITLIILTAVAILLMLARARTTFGFDKLK